MVTHTAIWKHAEIKPHGPLEYEPERLFSIADSEQDEPASRCCESGQGAVAASEKTFKVLERHETAPEFQERAHHVPNHVVEKAVSFDGECQSPSGTLEPAA